jgi:hypothetical protein
VRDREADAADPGRIRFSPSILPPYMRRSKSIETLLPILYLKGISTGDFSEALAALPRTLPVCRLHYCLKAYPDDGRLARHSASWLVRQTRTQPRLLHGV